MDFQRSQQAVAMVPEPQASGSEQGKEDTAHAPQSFPLTPVDDDDGAKPLVREYDDKDQEDDSDEENIIKGVYYDDEEGTAVQLE